MDFPTSRLLYPYNHDYRLYHNYAKNFSLKETCIATPFRLSKSQGDGEKPQLTEPTEAESRKPWPRSAYVVFTVLLSIFMKTHKHFVCSTYTVVASY